MRHLLAALLLLTATSALAVEPDEMLADKALEARAEKIDAQLRCVVCQSESIAESGAPLAKDLRLLVRERLTKGDTDEQVVDYVVERYGEYVLLKPRFEAKTFVLWMFPAIIAAGGLVALAAYVRKRPERRAPEPLSPDEEEALRTIIDERG